MKAPGSLPAAVLGKKAVVYVRQSSAIQVQENLEGQRRQYELADLARAYGFTDVLVIDEDLGRSGSGAEARPGFERLVGLLCAGAVGAVFCLEASRLARNGHDWHRLLELCGLVGARVVDADGTYDPCRPNDRLLLGMKGTISEFELGILRARLKEAQWDKARRGELRIGVPIGYVWDYHGAPAFHPDSRVQEFIRLVFRKFRELGSGRQVFLWLRKEGHCSPRSDERHGVDFEWRAVRWRSVMSLLKNPFYAGAYAYGKTSTKTKIVDGRPRKSYGHEEPMERWDVLIPDHHEGYITWEEFVHNQEILARNNFSNKAGLTKSGRGGDALLAGLFRCRRCGSRMRVTYSGRNAATITYTCNGADSKEATGWRACMAFAGAPVDRAVADELPRVLQPLALEAALEAERQLEVQLRESRRLYELDLAQARYDAQLAERRYAKADPDNRLVAAQLEKRWEDAMRRVAACEERLAAQAMAGPPPPTPEVLASLAADFSTAWSATAVTGRTRQRLIRALVEEIVADVDDAAHEVVLVLHWKGGQHSEMRVRRFRSGQNQRQASDEAIKVIRTMAELWPDGQIAATLNRMGLRSEDAHGWTAKRVAAARKRRGIKAFKFRRDSDERQLPLFMPI